MAKIPGGYYIKARKIRDSEVAHWPPHARELWDYLIREANHKPREAAGRTIKRGQLWLTYEIIREDLSWKVGYRKERYSRSQIETAMKLLTRATMVTTTKTTRGMIVDVCNYGFFQDPANYESHTENHTGSHADFVTINKKKEREVRKRKIPPIPPELNTPEFREAWDRWAQHRREIKKPLTPTSIDQQLKSLAKMGLSRAIETIEHTIAKGWQGLREPDSDNGDLFGGKREQQSRFHSL
jgi:hypothetical protein